MRLARIKATQGHVGVYHCMSRIVGGQHLLDDLYKEKFVALMQPLLKFCKIQIITYCVVSTPQGAQNQPPCPRSGSERFAR